jgi:hypothetical protein
MTASNDIFSEIVGEQLGAVTFVQDYLQLHFDGSTINVYMPMHVRIGGRVIARKEEAFRNALCCQIAKVVSSVALEPEEALRVLFKDDSELWISLRPSDYTCPEALSTHGFKRGIIVV